MVPLPYLTLVKPSSKPQLGAGDGRRSVLAPGTPTGKPQSPWALPGTQPGLSLRGTCGSLRLRSCPASRKAREPIPGPGPPTPPGRPREAPETPPPPPGGPSDRPSQAWPPRSP